MSTPTLTAPIPAPTPPLPVASLPGRRRWPLLVIGASAGTAVWSGWVGLGELVGFGVVHPLPGIWDEVTLNTAITLPVGVEAYAMYALSVATSTAPITRAARRFAWISSVAALALGMVGQVAYHLMNADHMTSAPWPIVAGVSCLPVLVLGVASVLWHLAGQTTPDTTATAGEDTTRDGGTALVQPSTTTTTGETASPRPSRSRTTRPKTTGTAATIARLRARYPDWTHTQIATKAGVSARTVSRHLSAEAPAVQPPTALPQEAPQARVA